MANKYKYMNETNKNILQQAGQQAMAESPALPLRAPLPVAQWSKIHYYYYIIISIIIIIISLWPSNEKNIDNFMVGFNRTTFWSG